MGLIRTATVLGIGYVFGARAGTDRYEEIVRTARALAARPEVQTYLAQLGEKTGLWQPDPAAAPDPATVVPPPTPGAYATPPSGAAELDPPAAPASVRRPRGR